MALSCASERLDADQVQKLFCVRFARHAQAGIGHRSSAKTFLREMYPSCAGGGLDQGKTDGGDTGLCVASKFR